MAVGIIVGTTVGVGVDVGLIVAVGGTGVTVGRAVGVGTAVLVVVVGCGGVVFSGSEDEHAPTTAIRRMAIIARAVVVTDRRDELFT